MDNRATYGRFIGIPHLFKFKGSSLPNAAFSKIGAMMAEEVAKQFKWKVLPEDKYTTANGLPYLYLIYYCKCKENNGKKEIDMINPQKRF